MVSEQVDKGDYTRKTTIFYAMLVLPYKRAGNFKKKKTNGDLIIGFSVPRQHAKFHYNTMPRLVSSKI